MRLVLVPAFAHKPVLVLVNLRTLETRSVTFSVPEPASTSTATS